MIDEILHKYHNWLVWLTEGRKKGTEERLTAAQTKTAIYEIGLEVIGKDVVEEDDSGGKYKLNKYLVAENRLRRQQRKAWAKACGVAEK